MQTSEQELIDVEKKYWQAIKDNDINTITSLTADDGIVTGAQGVSRINKKMMGEMMKNPGWKLNDFNFEDVQVSFVQDDVAVVAYKVTEKVTVEEKEVTLVANDASTWVKRDQGWVCVLHTESVAGDPFGRDRQPSA